MHPYKINGSEIPNQRASVSVAHVSDGGTYQLHAYTDWTTHSPNFASDTVRPLWLKMSLCILALSRKKHIPSMGAIDIQTIQEVLTAQNLSLARKLNPRIKFLVYTKKAWGP